MEKTLLLFLLLSSSSSSLPHIPYHHVYLRLFVFTNRHGKWQYLFTQVECYQPSENTSVDAFQDGQVFVNTSQTLVDTAIHTYSIIKQNDILGQSHNSPSLHWRTNGAHGPLHTADDYGTVQHWPRARWNWSNSIGRTWHPSWCNWQTFPFVAFCAALFS